MIGLTSLRFSSYQACCGRNLLAVRNRDGADGAEEVED